MRGLPERVGPGRSRRARAALITALVLIALTAVVVPAEQVRAASGVNLVAAGDFGARAATDTVLTRIADLNPDAALALGDLAYRDAVPETAWCAYVKALSLIHI